MNIFFSYLFTHGKKFFILFDISKVSIIITINPKLLAFKVSGFKPCYSSNVKFSGATNLSSTSQNPEFDIG